MVVGLKKPKDDGVKVGVGSQPCIGLVVRDSGKEAFGRVESAEAVAWREASRNETEMEGICRSLRRDEDVAAKVTTGAIVAAVIGCAAALSQLAWGIPVAVAGVAAIIASSFYFDYRRSGKERRIEEIEGRKAGSRK